MQKIPRSRRRARREKRAHNPLENPAIDPIVSARSLWLTVGNAAGAAVNEQTALGYSPVYCAVSTIAGDFAATPKYVYERIGDNKQRDHTHPAYRLLRRRAKPGLTAYRWGLIAMAHALVYGASNSWIPRAADGTPIGLQPLSPRRGRWTADEDGRTVYAYTPAGKSDAILIDSADVFNLLGPLTLDGHNAIGILDYATETLGRALAAQDYAARFFSQSGVPPGIITHPGSLDDVAAKRLSEQWHQARSGPANAHRVPVLEEGAAWVAMGVNPEDAQLLATAQFSVQEIARLFRIPASKLQDPSRGSYASLEQDQQSYWEQTLGPWFASFREEAYDKLLTAEQQENDTHTIEELQISILRADASARSNYYASALQHGWLNRDEVRAAENRNAIPGGAGETFLTSLAMAPADDKPADETDETDETDDDARSLPAPLLAAIFNDAETRLSARLTESRRRGHCPDLATTLERHAAAVEKILAPAHAAAVAIMGEAAPDLTAYAATAIDNFIAGRPLLLLPNPSAKNEDQKPPE